MNELLLLRKLMFGTGGLLALGGYDFAILVVQDSWKRIMYVPVIWKEES